METDLSCAHCRRWARHIMVGSTGQPGEGGYPPLQMGERDAEGPGCGQALGRARVQALRLPSARHSSAFLAAAPCRRR